MIPQMLGWLLNNEQVSYIILLKIRRIDFSIRSPHLQDLLTFVLYKEFIIGASLKNICKISTLIRFLFFLANETHFFCLLILR